MGPVVLGGRLLLSWRSLALAVGDLAMIALFVGAGELSHDRPLAAGIGTLSQFGLGWAIAALLVGAYGRWALPSVRGAVVMALGTWVIGALIGQLLRATLRSGFHVAPAFVLVSIGVGGALLATWRAIAARLFGPGVG